MGYNVNVSTIESKFDCVLSVIGYLLTVLEK